MSDERLIEFLAETVMGWHHEFGLDDRFERLRWYDTIGTNRAGPGWNPLEPGADVWMLWEKAAERGLYFVIESRWREWVAFPQQGEDALFSKAKSGPRALSLAIAKAFGYEEDAAIDAAGEKRP